ncbi:hypothetical protein Kpho01_14990 [Kitasatospora phosalacinea]|uniref:Uncharacterized protein n=1 Tax=Kitasatospora phosalacinea TaxID=2065 RepID=A0A9W6UMR6_9ACTN|nr:hypothetical protein Kpho01_14990 [Kitasatospora phosalacinea]
MGTRLVGPYRSTLYSGFEAVFREHAALLDRWAESTCFGEDAGLASLHDFAPLSAVYVVFRGVRAGCGRAGTGGGVRGPLRGAGRTVADRGDRRARRVRRGRRRRRPHRRGPGGFARTVAGLRHPA